MKRIEPVKEHRESDYPTAEEAGVNRRRFFQVVAAAGATTVAGVMIGADEARARGAVAMPSYRIAIDLAPPFRYARCKASIVQAIASTYDDRMASFLRDARERRQVDRIIRRVLRQHPCGVALGRGLYGVQSKISAALAQRYKQRTGRKANTTWIKLIIKRHAKP